MYCKELWTIISGTHLRVSCEIALNELIKAKVQILNGINIFKESTDESDKTIENEVGERFYPIVHQLRQFLGIDALQTWDLLSHYVMWDFHGDISELEKLVANDDKYAALMHSIWQFFRKERLFLLKCINLILTYYTNDKHPYQVPFASFMEPVNKEELFDSLILQLEKLSNEGYPTKQDNGPYMTHDYQLRWEGSNLREQIEVLNNLIVFMNPEWVTEERFKKILKICIDSRFGKQLESKAVDYEVHNELTGAIGFLQNIFLLQCLNLNAIQENPSKWTQCALYDELNEAIAELGSQEEHGPLILSWTAMQALECHGCIVDEQYLQLKLDEIAMNIGAFEYLEKLVRHHMFRDVGSCMTRRAYQVVYDVILFFANNFEKKHLHDLKGLLKIVGPLLRHPKIAEYFWSRKDNGLLILVEIITHRFPADFVPFIEVIDSLAANSENHMQELRELLFQMQNFTEVLNPELISEEIRASWFSGIITISQSRNPLPHSDFVISMGTTGSYLDLDSYLFLWKCNFSVVEAILNEQKQMAIELKSEEPYLQPDTKDKAIASLSFVKSLVTSMHLLPKILPESLPLINNVFQIIKELQLIIQTPSKVIALCLDIALLLMHHFPTEVMYHLKVLRIFPGCQPIPNDITAVFNVESCCSQTIGNFAQKQEAVTGKYPLLTSYLYYLHELIKPTSSESLEIKAAKNMQIILPGVVFILTEVFPYYQTWNFVNLRDSHIVAFTCIKIFHELLFVNHAPDTSTTEEPFQVLQKLVVRSLHNTRAGQELLRIVALGEAAIQSSMEKEFSWVSGQGMMGIYLVHHSLSVLNRVLLLKSEVMDKYIPSYLESEIYCSPDAAQRLKVIPTVASYIENIFSPNLATMAIKLLRRFAIEYPKTFLSCIGIEGDVLRSMMFRRLNSNFCSNQHKVALLQFVATCVDKQPGVCDEIFNLHLGRQPNRKKNVKCDIHGGVLVFACSVLDKVSKEPEIITEPLYGAVVDLICTIWLSESYAVIQYLRTKENFWKMFCAPLLFKPSVYIYAYSQVMYILTYELMKFGGNAHSDILEILETFFKEETGRYFENWSQFVARMFIEDISVPTSHSEDVSEIGIPIPGETQPPVLENVRVYDVAPTEETRTYTSQQSLEAQPHNIQLLISWKRFILVSLRRLPFKIGVVQKVHLSNHLMDALQNELITTNLKSILLIVELYLVLITDWHKRLFDDRNVVRDQIRNLFFSLASTYGSLHMRVKEAVLALILRAVDCLSTQIKQDETTAETLVKATCDIVYIELSSIKVPKETFEVKKKYTIQEEPHPLTFLQILYILMPELELKSETPPVPREPVSCELSLYLLHKLLEISKGTESWLKNYEFTKITTVLMSGYGTLLYIMSTIGMVSHYYNIASRIIHIMVFLAKYGLTPSSMDDLLRDNVWLMLIPSKALIEGPSPWVLTHWAKLYKPTVELILRHLKLRQYHFLQDSIMFTAIHEMFLVDCIHSFIHSLDSDVLELNLTVLYFIRILAEYTKEWNMNERSHRTIVRSVMSCLHVAVVLIINPLRLKTSLRMNFEEKRKQDPTILSQMTDGELSQKVALVQKKLLKMASMCLTIMKICTPGLDYLLQLSPQVPSTFITMMSIEFRPISFEDDDPLPVLSISTLVTLANLCQQCMTKVVRSSSSLLSIAGIRSGSELHSTTSVLATDMDCILMVFEMAIEMITIQGLFFVFNDKVAKAERIELRRKLYNDMIFFMEYARRCLHVPRYNNSLESRLVRMRAQLDLSLNVPLELESTGPVLPKNQEFAIVEKELREKIRQFRMAQIGTVDLKSHEMSSSRKPLTMFERDSLCMYNRYPVDIYGKMNDIIEDRIKRTRSLKLYSSKITDLDNSIIEQATLTPEEILAEPALCYSQLRPLAASSSVSSEYSTTSELPTLPSFTEPSSCPPSDIETPPNSDDKDSTSSHTKSIEKQDSSLETSNLSGSSFSSYKESLSSVDHPVARKAKHTSWGAGFSTLSIIGENNGTPEIVPSPIISGSSSDISVQSGDDYQSTSPLISSKDFDIIPGTIKLSDKLFTEDVLNNPKSLDSEFKIPISRTGPQDNIIPDVQENDPLNTVPSSYSSDSTISNEGTFSSAVTYVHPYKLPRYAFEVSRLNIRDLDTTVSEQKCPEVSLLNKEETKISENTISVETTCAQESTNSLKRPISKSVVSSEVCESTCSVSVAKGDDSDSSLTVDENESDCDPDRVPLAKLPTASNDTNEYLCTLAYIFNTIFEVPEFPSFQV